MGRKMVYNFLGIDEKTQRNLLTFNQNIHTVYLNIRAVYPNKKHVTTHPGTRIGHIIRFTHHAKQVFVTLVLYPWSVLPLLVSL